MPKIHLVTTCAKSKNGNIEDTIYPVDITNLDMAFCEWTRRLKMRFDKKIDVTQTESLYRGSHWDTALRIRNSRPDVSLWVISAGLGLRHSSDPAIPYEASFSNIPHENTQVWDHHIHAPIFPGRVHSLVELLHANNNDLFVVAASPLYLKAIEHDLLEGIKHVQNPKAQIIITTTHGYNGRLSTFVKYGSREMMGILNSNMTTLNIKHAEKIISGIPVSFRDQYEAA